MLITPKVKKEFEQDLFEYEKGIIKDIPLSNLESSNNSKIDIDEMILYGTADSIDQIKEYLSDFIISKSMYCIFITEINRADEPETSGFRFSKQGVYIGNKTLFSDYLYQLKDIDKVYTFSLTKFNSFGIEYETYPLVQLSNTFNNMLTNHSEFEILINSAYGGFSVSDDCYEFLGIEWDNNGFIFNRDRGNPFLLQAFKELGTDIVSGNTCSLKLVTISADEIFSTFIDSNDGYEEIVGSGRELTFEYDSIYSYISKGRFKGISNKYFDVKI